MQQQYPASASTPRAISANLLSLRRAIDAIVQYQNTPKYVLKNAKPKKKRCRVRRKKQTTLFLQNTSEHTTKHSTQIRTENRLPVRKKKSLRRLSMKHFSHLRYDEEPHRMK